MPKSTSTFVGVVDELWRYPVKSMIGERLLPIFGYGRRSVPSRRYQFRVGCIINTYGF
jgi:hypothetical protein